MLVARFNASPFSVPDESLRHGVTCGLTLA